MALQRAGTVEVAPALLAAVLASDAVIVRDEADGQWRVRGDTAEGALVVAAAKAALDKRDLDADFPRVNAMPFSSETNFTTLHETPQLVVAYATGAPEVILESCTQQLSAAGATALDGDARQALPARRSGWRARRCASSRSLVGPRPRWRPPSAR